MATKVKQLPHVAVLAKKYAQNKEYIMARLELTEEQYTTMVFETAEKWIKYHVWNDDSAASYLMSLNEFWLWFVNLWNIRDDAFFNQEFEAIINPFTQVEALRAAYNKKHRVEAITGMLPDNILRLLFKWAK